MSEKLGVHLTDHAIERARERLGIGPDEVRAMIAQGLRLGATDLSPLYGLDSFMLRSHHAIFMLKLESNGIVVTTVASKAPKNR